MKLLSMSGRRTKRPTIIKGGRYEDLPTHIQRAIDKSTARVKVRPSNKHKALSLEDRIKNILIGRDT